MIWQRFGGWTLLGLLLLLGGPKRVQACSCLSGLTYSLPSDGMVGVPLNVTLNLAFAATAPEQVTLKSLEGIEVPLTQSRQVSGTLFHIQAAPSEGLSLEPNTTYAVEGDGERLLEFSTSDQNDQIPPSLTAITNFKGAYEDGYAHGGYSSCGESIYLHPSYEGASDNLTASDSLLYRLVITAKTASHGKISRELVLNGSSSLGWGLCLTNFSELAVGDTVAIQAATIDAAGLQSPLTAQITATVAADGELAPGSGAESGSGCGHSTESQGASTFWLIGVSLLALRRRFSLRA